ncbi:MAG TPA: hypothetical protein VGC37_12250 [Friedmanniella sp.]
MTSSPEPTTDPEALNALADQLHDCITKTLEGWSANRGAGREGAERATRPFARPVTAPPVRMEQLARTPEPTADLDDLVDLLVPRLLDRLVPALREALRDAD